MQNVNKQTKCVCLIVYWGICFVGFKSRIRPRGTKSEAAAAIMNRGHKKNQATSVSSGPCPRGAFICEGFAILDAGRQREEKTKGKNTVYRFLPTPQTPQRE